MQQLGEISNLKLFGNEVDDEECDVSGTGVCIACGKRWCGVYGSTCLGSGAYYVNA